MAIRTAVIGAGFVGRVHLDALRRMPNVTIAAIGISPGGNAAKVSTETGIPATGDVPALLGDPSIDAVHLCTPNDLHYPLAVAALQAGKHVLCEKPLAATLAQAKELSVLAQIRRRCNAVCHNLRFYPLIQQARELCASGDLGEILHVQGTYSQDWLLYDTDFNWRVLGAAHGASRTMADIGSHWCDTIEHVTGLRILELCADLQTFHKARRRPKGPIETFAGKALTAENYESYEVATEDYGALLFHLGTSAGEATARGCFTASQVAAGRKNSFRFEIFGTKSGLAWDGERPNELWIGHRDQPNQILLKDPSLLTSAARPFADLPGGHAEGYADTFLQLFRRFYRSIEESSAQPDYPQFSDGVRQLQTLEAEFASHRRRGWVAVPSAKPVEYA